MKIKNTPYNTSSSLPQDTSSLPDDTATLKQLVAELLNSLKQKDSLVKHLEHQLEKLLRSRYGRKSEKIDWEGGLFPKEVIEELLAQANSKEEPTAEKEKISYERKKPAGKGHGRQEIPDHLPRVREEIEIDKKDKTCSVCNSEKIKIREEISEQLEFVPASLFVKQKVRPVYACPEEHEVTIAPKPSMPIERCLAGAGLLAQVAVSKYGDHLPLNRQEDIFSRNNVHISRSTQCDWMRQCADLMQPLYEHMKSTVLNSKVVHTDDTPVQVQNKKKTRKGRVWGYLDPIRKLAVFDYTPNRNRDGPEIFLGDFSGYLQADAYVGYDAIFAGNKIKEVACWAHARRYFFDAQSAQPESALTAVAWIKRLYDVERKAKAYSERQEVSENGKRKMLVMKRLELRKSKASEIMSGFDKWLKAEEEKVLPKSPMGKAISYTRSNWDALNRYLEDGDLSIDNNFAERAMRHVAVGRKNWTFFGSDRGGHTWAVITSLIYSAKLHELNIFEYMRDVITNIADTRLSELGRFAPDVWKKGKISE